MIAKKNKRLPVVGVIGPSKFTCTDEVYIFGIELGKMLAKLNVHMVCGGMEGIMEAVCLGFMQVNKKKGTAIGITPYDKRGAANPYCDIIIPSGIGISRNAIIVNSSDVLVAVSGGAGTLSEIAFAWQKNKHVICYDGFEGWAKKLGGTQLDSRRRKLLHSASDMNEIKQLIISLADIS
jgi:uncharacterized protein (TIGR00725 family)